MSATPEQFFDVDMTKCQQPLNGYSPFLSACWPLAGDLSKRWIVTETTARQEVTHNTTLVEMDLTIHQHPAQGCQKAAMGVVVFRSCWHLGVQELLTLGR